MTSVLMILAGMNNERRLRLETRPEGGADLVNRATWRQAIRQIRLA